MEKKELKERFFDRFFYAEDGSCDWDRWRKQDPSVVLEFILEELDRAREEVIKDTLKEIKESMESYLEDDTTTYEVVEMLLDNLLKDDK